MKKILGKLYNVQLDIQKMEKDGRNTFQNYNYLSETQITLKIKQLLDKHGLIFSHSSRITNILPFKSAKGVQNFLTNILVDYSFYDIVSGEKIRGKVAGQGTDSGDKGVYKAITGAIKYIYMKNFLIPTGDDPEQSIGAETPVSEMPEEQIVSNNYRVSKAGDKCDKCGAEMVKSPKTGKVFCSAKCWTK